MEASKTDTGVQEITDTEFSSVKDHLEEVDMSEVFNKETPDETIKEDEEELHPIAEGTPLGSLVSASFVLNLTNIMIPVVIVLGFKLSGYKTKKSQYTLTANEVKTLEEPLQKYLDYIKINLNNPLYNLMLALSIVYGAKIIEGLESSEKIKNNKEKVEEKIERKENLEEQAQRIVEEAANTEEWAAGYSEEQQALIRATRKRRNRSFEDSIMWLTKKNLL